MAKRRRSSQTAANELEKPAKRRPRPGIVHTSIYLPDAIHEALRQVAFDERLKIHDLIMEGVELVLRKHGYPSIEDLKAKFARKRL
jgi:hypothetical protein